MEPQNGSELMITRIFDAPVEQVWKAWTDPHYLMRWWGPRDFTSPSCQIDFRIGGKYLFCMRDPNGKDYWSTGVIEEILPMKKLVYTDSFADAKGNRVPGSYYGMGDDFPEELVVTLTFEDLGGRTKLILQHAGFPPTEMKDMAGLGWNQSFDKLAESLLV